MATPDKKSKPDRHIEMSLRHTFTEKETLGLARTLAEKNNELTQAEEEKKSVTSQLKARIDGISARVTEISTKITTGYEYRPTKCTVKYHTPRAGMKSLIRDDTGEVFETADMTDAEKQGELPLGVDKGKQESGGTVSVPADEGSSDRQE